MNQNKRKQNIQLITLPP